MMIPASSLDIVRPRRGSAGLSLMEMLVVLLVVMLVAAGAYQSLASAWDSQQTITGQNEAQRRAQRATDSIVDRIRGAVGVQYGDGDQVTCLFGDGSTLAFYRVGSELRRDRYDGSTGSTYTGEVVCRDVVSLSFSYYSRSDNVLIDAPLASLAESLEVSVRVSEWKYGATQTSIVKFRNKM
jgi:Tfp pilus assembly protein FimT